MNERVRVVLGLGMSLPPVLLAQVEAAIERDVERIHFREALRVILPNEDVDAIPNDQLEAWWHAENVRGQIEVTIREMAAETPALPNRKARRAEKARRR